MPGTSSNIEYFPKGSKVIAVEPEPVFEKLFSERKHEVSFSHVKLERFVHAYPESLEGLPDNSVDVVVATLVCCSVDRLDFTMREIKRVLARVSRYMQTNRSPFTPVVFDTFNDSTDLLSISQ